LSLSHQPPIVNDAEKKAGQHEPDRYLRVDARPANLGIIQFGQLGSEPTEVEDLIDAN
jgi:hypothetical protein